MRSGLIKRRIINSSALVLSCIAAMLLYRISQISFADTSEWTGWVLVASIVFLMLYAVRRRLSMLTLGSMSSWLQAHLYVAFFAIFVFLMHLDWSIPNGWFGVGLAVCLLGVLVTGFVGIFWSRRLPSLLTALGDEVLYDRIPGFSAALRDEAEAKILAAVKNSDSIEMADFYQGIGHQYFSRPKFQWSRLYRKYQPQRKIKRELETLRRYAGADGSVLIDEIIELIDKKSLLDAHYTFQGALRYWLFVHLAFALSIIPLVLVHIVLVYNFSSL